MTTKRIEISPKLIPVFAPPRGALRYRGAYGGRGSGKSFTFAKMAAIWGAIEPLRILCTRELQASIKDSFHAELKNAIQSDPWLESCYDVGIDYLRGHNGTEFMFAGLRHNIGAIKSKAQIDLCIVEEAEDVPERSWVDLLPTVRAPKSEVWVIWNPRMKGSPVDARFIQSEQPRSCIAEVNHDDNPWFPKVLDEQRKNDLRVMDPALYAHVWDGEYYELSDAQVLKGKVRVDNFEASNDWNGPYHGADWGFSQDPTAAVRAWVCGNTLYIDYEAGKVGLELDKTADFIVSKIPGVQKYHLRGDCSRPETISYLRRHGLPMCIAADKWAGSVEDGIQHLRSYDEIVIHPRCAELIKETRLYRYKIDRLSGDILPSIVDANNHYIDALRYALAPIIRKRKTTSHTAMIEGM